VYLVTGWLMLRHARSGDRKLQLARVYVADALPSIDASAARVMNADPAPIEARELVLAREK
jgi:hypothetical protein